MLQTEPALRSGRIAKLRKKAEEDSLKQIPFRPEVLERGLQSVVATMLKDDAQGKKKYSVRVQELENRRTAERDRKTADELKLFDFKPKTRKLPSYIASLAESHRIVREQREKENCPSAVRPSWR